MVDCVRRQQKILLCTYADVLCPGGQRCGDGLPARQTAYRLDTEEAPADADADDRFGVSINLRGSDIWLEPLGGEKPAPEKPAAERTAPERPPLERAASERVDRGHRLAPAGPTGRRASPRPAASWDVLVTRDSRGLGLSLESAAAAGWPGHVRVRRVFPHQPAARTGRIKEGDLLLQVNQMPMRGLSVQEVLHVLRLAGSEVLLTLARPTAGDSDLSASDGEEEQDQESRSSLSLEPDSAGTFTVELQKVNSTLGLSLRRTDDTVLGHTIRAKVREPALSDPRLRVGDKLVQVNGVDTTSMSHAEVVSLLRQCGDRVTLTLYRDGQATPGSPASPVSTRSTRLRPEAVEMLSGLAFRRELSLSAGEEGSPPPEAGRPGSRARQVRRLSCGSRDSPRLRRRRLTPSPDETASAQDPFARLAAADAMDGVTSELTRISESSLGAESDGWAGSGSDSDAELQERHLRRVAEEKEPGGRRSPARGRQVYLSVQPKQRAKPDHLLKRISSEERVDAVSPDVGGDLVKWKGMTLDGEEDAGSGILAGEEGATRGQDMCIQLRRGWSSRLGFSLHSTDGSHVVSQIHPDSVAERDGRLQIGDVLLKVNDVAVKGMTSEEVIDLLRKTKGTVRLAVHRP